MPSTTRGGQKHMKSPRIASKKKKKARTVNHRRGESVFYEYGMGNDLADKRNKQIMNMLLGMTLT